MVKKGFTYIEVMIAISIFAILVVVIMKLNITSESNLNDQITSQKMMFVAQKQMEKFKTTYGNIDDFTLIDGYYVKLESDSSPGVNLYKVTVHVKKRYADTNDVITLQSHVLKN